MFAAVDALIEAALAGATDDCPRLALKTRHPDIDDVRIARLNLQIHGAHLIGYEQHPVPRLPSIRGFEHAAFGVRFEGVTLRRHPGDVRICRMDAHRSDLAGVVETGELPRLSAIGCLVNAASG